MKKRATLNDIAKVLNLTKVSVSKALRDHRDISEATKIRVREVAEQLGYRPNLIARSLSSSKSFTIGVVVPKTHNFFEHIVSGIQNTAEKYDYRIVVTVSDENAELEKSHLENLVAMQVEGLLVSVSMATRSPEVYDWIRGMNIPLVFFDRHIPGLGFNSVIIDNEKAAEQAVEELIKRGINNIAHIGGYDWVEIGRKRRTGYERALTKHGIDVHPDNVVVGGLGLKHGYRGFMELMEKGVKPDAIFTVTYPVALGVYKAMKETKSELLHTLKVLTIGTDELFSVFNYPHYYMDQPATFIGNRACELLIKEIKGDLKPSNLIEFVETTFTVNE
jgi:LacI family transcriptional regulator